MNAVSKVIFDALAARRSVVLPGVGSLEVKRRKAKKISDSRIIPPQNVVTFTSKELEESDSVADLLVATGVPVQDARSQYQSWLESARSGEDTTIEDVGEIKDGKFVVAEPMHAALNPAGEQDVVTMEKERKGGPVWLWLLVGLVLAGLIFGGLWCRKKGCFEKWCKKDRHNIEAVAPVATPDTDPVVDPVAQPAPAKPVGPRFYVIAGSFSVESNADNYMAELKREHPELTLEKVKNPRNGNYLVSIFSAPTERQAYNKMNLYWDIDLYLWVFEAK